MTTVQSSLPPTVLLVEDDPYTVKAYQNGLTQAGIEVMTSFNGQAAWGKIQEQLPDLILLDLLLPEVDGFEFLEKLKQDSRLCDVPVIILTNLGTEHEVQRGKDLGAVDYIIKTNHSLAEVLERVKFHLPKFDAKEKDSTGGR